MSSEDGASTVVVNGETYQIDLKEGFEEGALSAPVSHSVSSGLEIKAGLPGSIFKVLVNVGDSDEKGQAVVIIEAMNMEIEVAAPESGIVSAVKVKQGDTIVNGQLLVVL